MLAAILAFFLGTGYGVLLFCLFHDRPRKNEALSDIECYVTDANVLDKEILDWYH